MQANTIKDITNALARYASSLMKEKDSFGFTGAKGSKFMQALRGAYSEIVNLDKPGAIPFDMAILLEQSDAATSSNSQEQEIGQQERTGTEQGENNNELDDEEEFHDAIIDLDQEQIVALNEKITSLLQALGALAIVPNRNPATDYATLLLTTSLVKLQQEKETLTKSVPPQPSQLLDNPLEGRRSEEKKSLFQRLTRK